MNLAGRIAAVAGSAEVEGVLLGFPGITAAHVRLRIKDIFVAARAVEQA